MAASKEAKKIQCCFPLEMVTNHHHSVAVPCIIVASVNAKVRWDAHWEHVAHEEHEHPRSERPEYPYQNIRTKNFWWGDGDKVHSRYTHTYIPSPVI